MFLREEREKKKLSKCPRKICRASGLLLGSNMPGKGKSPHVALLKRFDLYTGTAGQAWGVRAPPGCANTLPVFQGTQESLAAAGRWQEPHR